MRQLRVVGLGEDQETVILEDPIRHERFAIPGDERLRAASRGDVRRLGQMEIAVTTPLRPRDIQSRVRAGESVEDLAAQGGVAVAHVERFAYPVLLERARVAEMARRAHPIVGEAGRLDPRTLGEIVGATLAGRGQDPEDARWDAVKGDDGQWVVVLSWQAGRSDHTARWTFRPGSSGGTVTARDDAAREFLGEDPLAARRAATTPTPPAAPTPVDDDAPEPEVVAEEHALAVSGDTTPARHGGSRRQGPAAKARGASLAARDGRDARARPGRGATGATAGEHVPVPRSETPREAPRPETPRTAAQRPETEAPADPEPEPAPDAAPDAAPTRGRARRSHPIVPSWEDVLLGTRSPRT